MHSEITYGKNRRFLDWWVERDDKIYLFEVKACQFTLLSAQTGNLENLINKEIKKVAEAIEQVYSRIQEIPRHKELAIFRNKKIIPFIVFMDMPFISGDLYSKHITSTLKKIESEKGLTGLKDFSCFLMEAEELEQFSGAVEKIEIEDAFFTAKNDIRENFISVARKANGGKVLKNKYLDSVYFDFCKGITDSLPDIKREDGG